MKKNLLHLSIILIVCLTTFNGFAVSPHVVGSVNSHIAEASGLDYTGGTSFWTHNDGYGDNKLYKISNTGVLSKTITVTGATNNDWEDLTHDKGRTYMFIGDFGNNNSSRTNLKIYKIPYPSTVSGTTVAASVIKYSYSDQHRFPSKWLNFDVEAFFHHNGKLYLFTKADGNACGYSKLYTLPDVAGTQVATLVDSFPLSGRITSADVSPDGTTAVLISNNKIYMFRNWTGTNIFRGQYTKINIDGSWTQKEGVSFYTNRQIYLVDEGSNNKLFTVDLSPYVPAPRLASKENEEESVFENTEIQSTFSMYPNPANNSSTIKLEESFEQLNVFIFSIEGKLISNLAFIKPDNEIQIETEQLPPGFYHVQIIGDDRWKSTKMLSVVH